MWCLGCSGLSFGPLWSYRTSHDTNHPVVLPLKIKYDYLPWLHRNVAACPIDAVFIVVGDQATTIEHFIRMENSSLFQGWMQSWSVQLLKCWLLEVKSAKSHLSWSRLGFVVKFIGKLKLIGDYPCLHTKRRQHGCPARPLATNHRDFP